MARDGSRTNVAHEFPYMCAVPYLPEVTMRRVSLALAVAPTIFFGFITVVAAQHPPSGPQRRDRPSGQFVNYNGQLRWVPSSMLTLSSPPRPPVASNLGQYARGATLPFLRSGQNAYPGPRSTRLRRLNHAALRARPTGSPAQFLQPRTFQQPQAPQRNYAPPLFRLRP